jgi:hypothetical protein
MFLLFFPDAFLSYLSSILLLAGLFEVINVAVVRPDSANKTVVKVQKSEKSLKCKVKSRLSLAV